MNLDLQIYNSIWQMPAQFPSESEYIFLKPIKRSPDKMKTRKSGAPLYTLICLLFLICPALIFNLFFFCCKLFLNLFSSQWFFGLNTNAAALRENTPIACCGAMCMPRFPFATVPIMIRKNYCSGNYRIWTEWEYGAGQGKRWGPGAESGSFGSNHRWA